jgi:hypothetical protein
MEVMLSSFFEPPLCSGCARTLLLLLVLLLICLVLLFGASTSLFGFVLLGVLGSLCFGHGARGHDAGF